MPRADRVSRNTIAGCASMISRTRRHIGTVFHGSRDAPTDNLSSVCANRPSGVSFADILVEREQIFRRDDALNLGQVHHAPGPQLVLGGD